MGLATLRLDRRMAEHVKARTFPPHANGEGDHEVVEGLKPPPPNKSALRDLPTRRGIISSGPRSEGSAFSTRRGLDGFAFHTI